MLTGALASSYYGQPRTTMDIDVIVRISRKELPRLLTSLEKARLEVNERKVESALKTGYRIITLKDTRSPHTVDIILSDHPLRRRSGSILRLPTYYETPEGLLLTKLRMIKATLEPERVSKDRQDVKSIIRFTKVNLSAVKKNAEKETTANILADLLRPPKATR